MASSSTGTPSPRWHALPSFPGLPPLFIAPVFETSSYTVQVTDLANIWAETLDRKQILRRALNEDISIDLSDGDPTQWSLFFAKLRAALLGDPSADKQQQQQQQQQGLTSLSLSSSSSSSGTSGDDNLIILHTTHILPSPLPPLKWPIHLARLTRPSELASRLVVPLIRAHAARGREVDELVGRLRDKDAVIAKLVDKLEAHGVGLEMVFNSLSGKRKVGRAVAEEKVLGLKPFTLGADADAEDGGGSGGGVAGWTRHVGGFTDDLPVGLGEVEGGGELSRVDDWWVRLRKGKVTAESRGPGPVDADGGEVAVVKSSPAVNPTAAGNKKNPSKVNRNDGDDNEDDGDFQVQATPPHLQATRRRRQGNKADDGDIEMGDHDTTDDEDEEKIPDSYIGATKGEQHSSRPKLGAIGAKKEPSSQPTSSAPSSRTVPVHDDAAPSASRISSDEDDMPPRRAPIRRTGGGSGLGTIGGSKKNKAPTPSPPSPQPRATKDSSDDETASGSDSDDDNDEENQKKVASPPPPPASASPPPQRKKGGIGAIGGRRKPPAPSPPPQPDPDETIGTMRSSSPAKEAEEEPEPKKQPPTPAKPAGRKIGAIGGARKAAAATATTGISTDEDATTAAKRPRRSSPTSSSKSAAAAVAVESHIEEEDDEQRAERRRAELAKELEKKAAAPAKKKRRF